jgi:thiol-disulfide isomerase/thioredoxin
MPRLKTYLIVLFAAVLLVPTVSWSLQKGTQLPELSGHNLNGDKISLNQLEGKPILLKVGTTWCPTCGQQSREITKLRNFISDNNISYVEVFIQETADNVQNYFDNNDYLRPDSIIIDQGDIARALNIYLIPRLILVDRNLKIFRDGDPLLADALKVQLKKMLTVK